MLILLIVTLASAAHAISMGEEEVRKMYQNELAQTYGEVHHTDHTELTQIEDVPTHDQHGKAVQPAGYLYKVCVNDFQSFILNIRALISEIDTIDTVTVPGSAQLLWDSRGTPEVERDLNNLVAEYKSAVSTGDWVPAEKPDAVFPDMENEQCNYREGRLQRLDFVSHS